MSKQKLTSKFKGKYFVSVIAKFQFSVTSKHIAGLTMFLCIPWCLATFLCTKLHAVFNNI